MIAIHGIDFILYGGLLVGVGVGFLECKEIGLVFGEGINLFQVSSKVLQLLRIRFDLRGTRVGKNVNEEGMALDWAGGGRKASGLVVLGRGMAVGRTAMLSRGGETGRLAGVGGGGEAGSVFVGEHWELPSWVGQLCS